MSDLTKPEAWRGIASVAVASLPDAVTNEERVAFITEALAAAYTRGRAEASPDAQGAPGEDTEWMKANCTPCRRWVDGHCAVHRVLIGADGCPDFAERPACPACGGSGERFMSRFDGDRDPPARRCGECRGTGAAPPPPREAPPGGNVVAKCGHVTRDRGGTIPIRCDLCGPPGVPENKAALASAEPPVPLPAAPPREGEDTRCATCGGVGFVKVVESVEPGVYYDAGEPCDVCEGTGRARAAPRGEGRPASRGEGG